MPRGPTSEHPDNPTTAPDLLPRGGAVEPRETVGASSHLRRSSTKAAEPPQVIEPSPSSQGSLTADTGSAGSCPPRPAPSPVVVPTSSHGQPGAFDDLPIVPVPSMTLQPNRRRHTEPPSSATRSPTTEPHQNLMILPAKAGRHRRPRRRRGAHRVPLSPIEGTSRITRYRRHRVIEPSPIRGF